MNEREIRKIFAPLKRVVNDLVNRYEMTVSYGGTSSNFFDEPTCVLNWSNPRGLTCKLIIIPLRHPGTYQVHGFCRSATRQEGFRRWRLNPAASDAAAAEVLEDAVRRTPFSIAPRL